ncbi:MAG TPA: cupin domain-containing protein [Candidatus Sulfotelmatobacter sp.]|nr:cupin domain-containing protein [Candidatus Sulfotelmatobacter sp.]
MGMRDAEYWIEKLHLERHPEGGYFRQTYRADMEIAREALPAGFTGPRSVSTGIYFLLQAGDFSAFHRLRSDEMWHFYSGSRLLVHVIDASGDYTTICLGDDPDKGELFQAVVKAGRWFGSEIREQSGYSLVGCTVAPGFDFDDFQMAKRAQLVREYPQHREIIERLTRE